MSHPPVVCPPLDGSIPIFTDFVDFHATHNPEHPYGIFPTDPDAPSSGTTSVSFLEFARATHRVAHALQPNTQGGAEVVAVLVNTDSILYAALIAGMIRAGLVPFLMSSKNSPEAVCSMLERTSCHRIVSQLSLTPLIDTVRAQLAVKQHVLRVDELPALRAIFPRLGVETSMDTWTPYPYGPSPPDMDAVVLYLHSSGSTGFPKPVPQTHRTILHWCGFPSMKKTRQWQVRWASMGLPTFHTYGISFQLYGPLVAGQPIGMFTPRSPALPTNLSPENTIEVARATNCTGLVTVPSILEVLVHSEEAVKYLASLQAVVFSGGPLSTTSGDKLAAAGVALFPIYGCTESGGPCEILDIGVNGKTPADWAWMQFSDRCRCRWVDQGDGTYELHILTCETHQLSVENLSDTKGYATSDLWEPHPTKKGLWRIIGRLDDVIVLSTGEKVVPLPQEGHISSSPLVSGAVMFGRGRSQVGILLEPQQSHTFDPHDQEALAAFRNAIWPCVEEANRSQPAFARIFKEMIIVTDAAKPLPRAGKGTVQRKFALAAYADTIKELYETVEASADTSNIGPPKSWSVDDVEAWLCEHATFISNDAKPSTTADLFEQGFDSLSATYLRNRIIGTLRSSDEPHVQKAAASIDQSIVFNNPTLHTLAERVVELVHSRSGTATNRSSAVAIEDMIAKYSADLPARLGSPTAQRTVGGAVILLTGTTGSLGSHVLASLLADGRVVTVYALNRASGIQKQKNMFEDQGLSVQLLSSGKLRYLTGDLGRDDFGLDPTLLGEIKNRVTHVIHNAWRVDFNLSLSSFDSYVATARRFINMCAEATQEVRLLFTSSIAAAQGWDISRGAVPESVLPEPQVAAASGYGASKYVVEQLFAKAAQGGLSTTTLRIGQVCGSTGSGTWNTTEWVPILVKSSIAVGCLPSSKGVVSWIPMDAVARAIVDITLTPKPLPELVNLVHPHPVPWCQIMDAINDELGLHLPLVPFTNWVSRVKSRASESNDLDEIPAIKLLDFFQGIASSEDKIMQDSQFASSVEAGGAPIFDTAKAQQISSTITHMLSIGGRDAAAWVKYWRSKGFIA